MIFDRNLNSNLAAMLMSTVATFLLILSWLAVTHSSLHDTGQGSHVEIKVDGIKVLVDPCSLETRPGGTASEVMCDVEVKKTDRASDLLTHYVCRHKTCHFSPVSGLEPAHKMAAARLGQAHAACFGYLGAP
jgi:hypothetical protein